MNLDILILTNGPGEVTTWVRPVVQELRKTLGNDRQELRISVVLSPCPNGSGEEVNILKSYPEVDRVQSAEDFYPFLLFGKTKDNWTWYPQGIVIFLGGDQFFPIVIGKRLGYKTLIYAEWIARWHSLIDHFAIMNESLMDGVKEKYRSKFTVVGDLMVESQNYLQLDSQKPDQQITIGILPGSKALKLQTGLPFTAKVAELILEEKPHTRFIIPVAPTVTVDKLAKYGDRQVNPLIDLINGTTCELVVGDQPKLVTDQGVELELHTQFPAYDILSQCDLCLTTIGANTAELGALGIPMIVLVPVYQLDSISVLDGLPGLLSKLPLVGKIITKTFNTALLKQVGDRKFAWPNIWANQYIVPELIGSITPEEVANLALIYLDSPEKLLDMRQKLQKVRGSAGASQKIVEIVRKIVDI